ncbi:MAG TPA: hypothetical protein VFE60_01040 [Roseiarcus sp.]|jgi:hypothetical protein|nr:hypothetical protein [Roseiarcus sp.]
MRTRKLKPQHQRPMFQPDTQLIDRIDRDRRERERIEVDRARRSAERRAAAIALRTRRADRASTNAQPLEDWSARDAAWFVAHPGRNHRVRCTVEGEFMPPDQHARWVAIRQIAPGVRARLAVEGPWRRFAEWVGADEDRAALLFELLAHRGQVGALVAALEKASPVQPSSGGA